MHGRSRTTIDPRIPPMPGRSTSGFHRPGRRCLHQARSAVRCSASRMKWGRILFYCFLCVALFSASVPPAAHGVEIRDLTGDTNIQRAAVVTKYFKYRIIAGYCCTHVCLGINVCAKFNPKIVQKLGQNSKQIFGQKVLANTSFDEILGLTAVVC